MPATIHSLPAELLRQIFEHLTVDRRHGSIHLQSCALVCQGWREQAQSALVPSILDVDCSTEYRANAWLDASGYHLYPMRWLTIGFDVSLDSCLAVMTTCTGLEGLNVRSGEKALGGYPLFHTEQAKNITAATIHRPALFPTDAIPLACRLRDLTLYLHGGVSAHTINTILISSRDTLQTLFLDNSLGADDPSLLVTFFANNPFPKLHTLRIDACRQSWNWSGLLRHLPHLTHLQIDHSDFKRIFSALSNVSGAAATSPLQPQMKVLTMSDISKFSIQPKFSTPLLRTIRLPLFAGLEELILPDVKMAELEGPVGLTLMDECVERSIVLKCWSGIM
ncbi:hypothetical protein RQP46_010773 [Phenoliferia psychrophenolica]